MNNTILKNEECIDSYICKDGDKIEFGKGISNNIPLFYLSRMSGDNCKGTVFFTHNSIIGLSKVINNTLNANESFQKPILLDYSAIKGLMLSISEIKTGIYSHILFLIKNKTDGSVKISLENMRINGEKYKDELSSKLLPHAKKNKEITFDIGPISNRIKKLEMDVVVNATIDENPCIQRKRVEMSFDYEKCKIKHRISDKNNDRNEKANNQKSSTSICKKEENTLILTNMKKQEVLFRYNIDKSDVLNFGKGTINDLKYFYFKYISEGIITGGVVLDSDSLVWISKTMNEYIEGVLGDVSKGFKVISKSQINILLDKAIVGPTSKLVFLVRNRTGGNIRLELNNIEGADPFINKNPRSDFIQSSSENKKIIFSLGNLKKEKNTIRMIVTVKIYKNDKLRSESQEIEVIIDSNGIRTAQICGPLTVESQQINESRKEPASEIGALINYHYFLVYTNNITCKKLKHQLDKDSAVVGVIQKKSGVPYIQQYEVPICKCYKCKAFYITESVFNELKSKGKIISQVLSQKEFDNKEFGNDFEEHIMHKFGYSVRADGPNAKQRQVLLEQLIQSDIVSKKEAVNHIKSLISRNETKKQMKNAIKKWNDDIEYLTGQRVKTGIKAIIVSKDIKLCMINNFPK